MTLIEVSNRKHEDMFIDVHVRCNSASPAFIRPLDRDIRAVFDPEKNKTFRFGEAVRWILLADDGVPVGRIAAFVNSKYTNKGDEIPVGGIGFFDCPNDQSSANMLFDKAREWLVERGMEAMDGPINFGQRNNWWGLLVEGFEPPLYGMSFNPPYYQELFENYGFKNFYDQICWHTPFTSELRQLEDKFYVAHEQISADPAFSARTFDPRYKEKFAEDFSYVHNMAWAGHEGNRGLSKEQVLKILKAMKPVMDKDLLWFAYHGDQPIAIWISVPDINTLIKGFNGKLGLLEKLKFAYRRLTGVLDRFVGILFGVVPEFQGKGVDYYLIVEAEKDLKKKMRYKELELQWIGGFNPKMLKVAANLGSRQKRRLVTYRYLFDRNAQFKRHPLLGVD